MAKTVLVIDDDPTQRRLLTAAVEKAGFACRTAPDGETGVSIATAANAGADVVCPAWRRLKCRLSVARMFR